MLHGMTHYAAPTEANINILAHTKGFISIVSNTVKIESFLCDKRVKICDFANKSGRAQDIVTNKGITSIILQVEL